MEPSENQEALEFSDAKQRAVVGHLLLDERFWHRVSPHVRDWWFGGEPWCAKWFEAIRAWYAQYRRLPTIPEAREMAAVRAEEPAYRVRMLEVLEEAVARTTEYRQDALGEELLSWGRAMLLKSAVERASQLWNGRKSKEAEQVIEGYRQEVSALRLERDPEVDWRNFEHHFARQEQELDNALTWGNPVFDRCLNPLAKSGSLLLGNTTLVIAPTGRGKTTTMYNVVVPNVLAGEPAMVFAHEGKEDDHIRKCWCILLDISPRQLFDLYRTPQGVEALREMSAYLFEHKYLCFIPMQRAGQTIEEVVDLARRKQEERLAKFGKGYKLICSDYPGVLGSSTAQASRYEYRHLRRYVFDQFVDLNLELNTHGLAAAQGTRESSKILKGISREQEVRLLTKEDIGEAWAPCERCDTAITVNRPPTAEYNNWVAYFIDKSRSSGTGFVVTCRSNFAHFKTHSAELGAVWYRSTGTMANRMHELLDQFRGGAIPEEAMVD